MKKGFTLAEVMITVIVILILATVGMATYKQVLDNAYQKVCAGNLAVLKSAVEIYAIENDVLPATLGQLKLEHLEKAYARAAEERDWQTKFSYFFVKLNSPRPAYAQIAHLNDLMDPDEMQKRGIDPQIFICPADHTPPPGGISYGINQALLGLRWENVPSDTAIVGDCDADTFASLAPRHIQDFGLTAIAQTITKDSEIETAEGKNTKEMK